MGKELIFRYFITDLCNLNCSYCFNKFCNESNYTVSYNDIDTLVSNLNLYCISKFEIIGGEPADIRIQDKTKYLIQKLYNLQSVKEIVLYTNLINKNFLSSIIKYKDKTKIMATYHPRYNNENNFGILKLFKTHINIPLDCRYNENIINFYRKYNLKHRISFIILNNSGKLLSEYGSFKDIESLCSNLKINYEELRKKFLFEEKYLNKACYNNIINISQDGTVKYTPCFREYNKQNIYKNRYLYEEIKIICKNNYEEVCCKRCSLHYHE